jgi:hypothetical protein
MENNIYLFDVKLLHLSSSAFLISLIQLDNKWLKIFLFRHTHNAIWRHLSSSSLSIFQLRRYLFATLKSYDHAGPKGTVELTINTVHRREKSKHKRSRRRCMSSAAIQRNIETRPSHVHIHSIKITYIVHRHIALFGEEESNLIRSAFESDTHPILPGLPDFSIASFL